MEANVEVDITGLDALERVLEHCERESIRLCLVRVTKEIESDLMLHGVGVRIGQDYMFPTLPTAVAAFEQETTA